MNMPLGLRLVDDDEAPPPMPPEAVASAREEPKVFVRTLSTPAGLPWDQSRAAELEARLGAPLPLGEIVYQLRRLEAWRPGEPARWAAVYVRVQEVGDRFATSVQAEGRAIPIVFVSAAERRRASRRFLLGAAAAASGAALILAAGGTLLSARSDAAAELDAAEQIAASRLSQARALKGLKDQARLLDGQGLHGRSLAEVMNDLAWASTAKAPDARVVAVHWDRRYMAFEIRGDGPAFVRLDRPVRKSNKPGPGGVALWGVAPAEIGR